MAGEGTCKRVLSDSTVDAARWCPTSDFSIRTPTQRIADEGATSCLSYTKVVLVVAAQGRSKFRICERTINAAESGTLVEKQAVWRQHENTTAASTRQSLHHLVIPPDASPSSVGDKPPWQYPRASEENTGLMRDALLDGGPTFDRPLCTLALPYCFSGC